MTGFAGEDHFFEVASDAELDHGAGSHVDGVGADAAVEFAGVHGEGLALLDHVFAVVEGLEADYFDDTDGHADGGVLEFVQFGGHVCLILE